MRRIRILALGIASFVVVLIAAFLSPGTWLNRAIASAMCTVFSFNSAMCTVDLGRSSDRVVAATPPAVERMMFDGLGDVLVQRSREFDDDQPINSPPVRNLQVPSFPQDPGPNQPLRRPDFDDFNSNYSTQNNSSNYPFVGTWLYTAYASTSRVEPFYVDFVQIKHSGEEYTTFLCKGKCNIQNLMIDNQNHILKEYGLAADYQNFSIEIAETTNHKIIVGEIVEKATAKKMYFILRKLLQKGIKSQQKSYKKDLFFNPRLSKITPMKILPHNEYKMASLVRWVQKSIGSSFTDIMKNNFRLDSTDIYDVQNDAQKLFDTDNFRSSNQSGVSASSGANNNFGGQGRNRQGNNQNPKKNENSALERIGSDISNAEQSPQQGREIGMRSINFLAAAVFALGTALSFLFQTPANASNVSTETRTINNRNQSKPQPKPSTSSGPPPGIRTGDKCPAEYLPPPGECGGCLYGQWVPICGYPY
ncbi:hypothetical protein [Anabaena sp. UHCC 0451]|uniref:hypothetical protein n=1 Tax=Anabaena sp. UHCC 0451 TaxID=2055235 RepID=UPI002B209008|nr:hypothetical protein [Anabaena sp. UHCC 0451]MEA5576610.1 hypothetical protein [Anabaena sp. UHCC 0451]